VDVSVFPGEFYQSPRSWAEQAYAKLIHYNKVVKGGHFPAWEQPKLFSEEIRTCFRALRALRTWGIVRLYEHEKNTAKITRRMARHLNTPREFHRRLGVDQRR
jgi:hypothetical protein